MTSKAPSKSFEKARARFASSPSFSDYTTFVQYVSRNSPKYGIGKIEKLPDHMRYLPEPTERSKRRAIEGYVPPEEIEESNPPISGVLRVESDDSTPEGYKVYYADGTPCRFTTLKKKKKKKEYSGKVKP
ncbi:hypothetical protein BVC80_9061g45 [Macleaya cordata]|uniref:Uncharacterized protein n=1 Tax=Macleaya cordata TaxID=56857 RepID=A0A200PN32_MACCD|nr:hypothetical protein BVC80_9061g45 [Macleaya cordata]